MNPSGGSSSGAPELGEAVNAVMPDTFCEGMCDFVRDLTLSFPEYAYLWCNIRRDMPLEHWKTLYAYCVDVYPKAFMTIMYECEEDLDDPSSNVNADFLPHVNFRMFFSADQVTDSIKAALWKYLQMILCIIIPHLSTDAAFGDMSTVFEAMDEDALAAKLAETAEGLSDFFARVEKEDQDKTGGMDMDTEEEAGGRPCPEGPSFDFGNMPRPEEVNDRLHTIMGGKLGQFAKELSDEFQTELGADPEVNRIQTTGQMMAYLAKHPRIFASILHRMSVKLNEKIRNGEMTRADIKREMDNLMSTMSPEEIESMLSTMSAAGHDTSLMRENIRRKQMRDRLRKKAFAASLKRERAPPPAQPTVDPYAHLSKYERKLKRREDRERENAELDAIAAFIG